MVVLSLYQTTIGKKVIMAVTGLVLVGPKAKRTTGPVIIAVEDLERLPSMVRAGERLAAVSGGALVILPIADDEDRLHWMEGEVRLLLGDRKDAQIIVPASARGALFRPVKREKRALNDPHTPAS